MKTLFSGDSDGVVVVHRPVWSSPAESDSAPGDLSAEFSDVEFAPCTGQGRVPCQNGVLSGCVGCTRTYPSMLDRG